MRDTDPVSAEIYRRVTEGGPGGVHLSALIGDMGANGHSMSAVSTTLTRLILDESIELTADRTVQWASGGCTSPDPAQRETNADDAEELRRLVVWLGENCADTRLAGEGTVDWAIRLLKQGSGT